MDIRNFCIIAHIDHGKSTLADRMLEVTGTIDKRKMKEQFLDQLELERERGITIKMAPVRMAHISSGKNYILNLIDTPGHPDFGYEVSRALEAVEGAVLLVDGTQGIQAQTLSNFHAAKKAGLTIIGAVNKVDMFLSRLREGDPLPTVYSEYDEQLQDVVRETAALLDVDPEEIHLVSGKTGFGVGELLDDLIARVPAPRENMLGDVGRALVFDSFYDDHKGIVATIRVFDGCFKAGDEIVLLAVNEKLKAKEVGYFFPNAKQCDSLSVGEIGYIVTGLKDPHKIKIGDTVVSKKGGSDSLMLAGYKEPNPVVFVSFFPDDADDYDDLKKSLERLKLNDSSFVYDPDFNEVLGRGFKGGFLGKLHFEIIAQRLDREFGIQTITSFPSVSYKIRTALKEASPELAHLVRDEEGFYIVQTPKDLPSEYFEIYEPMIRIELVCPHALLGPVLGLQELFRWEQVVTETLGDRIIIKTKMPLAELISDFDDRLKSISGGFASFSYEFDDYKKGQLQRLDILVANEVVPGLSRILPTHTLEREARKMVIRLKDTLPRQQFPQAIQGKALGRILARETIPAMKKDLGNFGKNGGDRTRKMKLWNKQKRGKKRLLSMAQVRIAPEDFKKLLSK